MIVLCPLCGLEVTVNDDGRHVCARCVGERLPEAVLLERLKRPGHWDAVLGAWLVAVGAAHVGLPFLTLDTLICFAPMGLLSIMGGARIMRADPRPWAEATVASLVHLGLCAWILLHRDPGFLLLRGTWDLTVLITTGVHVATLVALYFYYTHPVARFRRDELTAEALRVRLGDPAYDRLLHRLSLGG